MCATYSGRAGIAAIMMSIAVFMSASWISAEEPGSAASFAETPNCAATEQKAEEEPVMFPVEKLKQIFNDLAGKNKDGSQTDYLIKWADKIPEKVFTVPISEDGRMVAWFEPGTPPEKGEGFEEKIAGILNKAVLEDESLSKEKENILWDITDTENAINLSSETETGFQAVSIAEEGDTATVYLCRKN